MSKVKGFLLVMVIMIVAVLLILQKEISQTLKLDTKSNDKVLVDSNSYVINIDKNDYILGNPGATNMIVEYLNLGKCNAQCQTSHQKLYDFVKANPTQAALVFKHTGSKSLFASDNKLAHMAVICAGEQNKLWDFINALVKDKNRNEKSFSVIAQNLNINIKTFNTCINDQKTLDKVNDEFAKAELLPIDADPTIFINSKKINVYEDVDLTELLTKATSAATEQ